MIEVGQVIFSILNAPPSAYISSYSTFPKVANNAAKFCFPDISKVSCKAEKYL